MTDASDDKPFDEELAEKWYDKPKPKGDKYNRSCLGPGCSTEFVTTSPFIRLCHRCRSNKIYDLDVCRVAYPITE